MLPLTPPLPLPVFEMISTITSHSSSRREQMYMGLFFFSTDQRVNVSFHLSLVLVWDVFSVSLFVGLLVCLSVRLFVFVCLLSYTSKPKRLSRCLNNRRDIRASKIVDDVAGTVIKSRFGRQICREGLSVTELAVRRSPKLSLDSNLQASHVSSAAMQWCHV